MQYPKERRTAEETPFFRQTDMENRNTPAVPLPNPGEGGAVFPGENNEAVENGQVPVIPLPNPGEGGTVNPGTSGGGSTGGSTIIIQPLPGNAGPIIAPARYAAARFLNATHGYPDFRINVDGTRVVNLLPSGTASGYIRLTAGTHTITVYGVDGYIYIEKAMNFTAGSTSTVAIINRTGGLDLVQIADACRVV